MKTKFHPAFSSRQSVFAAFGAALLAAITLFTALPRAPAQSVWGNALSFDGTNDYVQAGNVPLANASFTIEAWARRDTSDTMDMIVAQGAGVAGGGLMFGFHWFGFDFDFYGDGLSSPDVDNSWHHWAGTYDASNKVRCLYRDGVLLATNVAAQHYQGSGPLCIGQAFNDAYFAGIIDEVRIWNVTRSAAEIRQHLSHRLTGQESNLIAYWKFDEGASPTAHDSTTNDYDGTLNGPQWTVSTIPPWGKALSFDGTNDYVLAGNVPLSNASFTIEAWARRDTTGTMDMIVGQGSMSGHYGLLFGFHWDYVGFVFDFYGDGVLTVNNDNVWHHWAGTYDASNRVQCLYRDGVLLATNVADQHYQGSGPLEIGQALGQAHFAGVIDEVRIWNVARTRAEIQAGIFHPLTGAETNLVAYWNFDEGAGTTNYDSTMNGWNGIPMNGAQWIPSTIPSLTAPVFAVCRLVAPGQLRLQATGTPGLSYTLQSSTNLLNWVNDTNLVASPGGLIEYVDEMDASACFYRLKWP